LLAPPLYQPVEV